MKNTHFLLGRKTLTAIVGSLFASMAVSPSMAETITVDGKQRTIDVYAPAGLPKNRPLLISAHGMGQDIAYQKNQARWADVADTAKFVVVYPQGEGNSWDLGGSKDINFMKAIVSEMKKRYDIDLNRCYMSGFSMGGMFTYYCANQLGDVFAAFAPVSGYPIAGAQFKSARPLPIIHTNGDADDVVHYEPWSGTFNGMHQNQIGAYAMAEGWAKFNKCDSKPVESKVNNCATRYVWKNGECGVEVCLNKIPGKGHWHSNDEVCYHTSREIWKFISRYTLNCGNTEPEPAEEVAPYGGKAATIPGVIEAENYNLGGQGVSYYDEDRENQGGEYRKDGVDIVKGGSGYAIGYTVKGEWMQYTVNIAKTAKYNISVNASSGVDGAGIILYLDGKAITSTINVPNKEDFDVYGIVKSRTSEISAGEHTLKLEIAGSYVNVDNITFEEYDPSQADVYDENGCVVGNRTADELASLFSSIKTGAASYKSTSNHNPLITQRYGADPCAMVYGDSVYIYMTHDIYEYDNTGSIKENGYGKITDIVCISSADLVNWTDHGPMKVAGSGGTSKAVNSWAPTACHAKINGKDRFFLYFANNANGIYVVSSDTPYGPWEDCKNGQGLITRSTPNCNNVTWLFDPAVVVDDDGTGYIYFGGGVPSGKQADPGTARVAKLGKDFISIDGTPAAINPPYLFEDAGANKIGDTYVYSYCTNWNCQSPYKNANIAYMTSKNPMGPFTFQKQVFENPGVFFGSYGNNHHSFFKFKDKWYITYHSQWLQDQMKVSGGYRCSNINELPVNEASAAISSAKGDLAGVSQTQTMTNLKFVQAECFAWRSGVSVDYVGKSVNMAVKSNGDGSWIGLAGVEPKGVNHIKVRVASECGGAIRITLDKPDGEAVGYINIPSTGGADIFDDYSAWLEKDLYMSHDLFFTFIGDVKFDSWSMTMEDKTGDEIITNSTKELVVEENPVETSISLDNLVEGEYVDFYSIDGRLLKSVEADSTKMSISLSGIPSGINVVRNANRSVRFIKK